MTGLALKIVLLSILASCHSHILFLYQEVQSWMLRDKELGQAAEQWSQNIQFIQTLNQWIEDAEKACLAASVLLPASSKALRNGTQFLALMQDAQWASLRVQIQSKRLKKYFYIQTASQKPRTPKFCTAGTFEWSE
jgi:hypothetical protein